MTVGWVGHNSIHPSFFAMSKTQDTFPPVIRGDVILSYLSGKETRLPSSRLLFEPTGRVVIEPPGSRDLFLPLVSGRFTSYEKNWTRGQWSLRVTGLPSPHHEITLLLSKAPPKSLAVFLRCFTGRRMATAKEMSEAAAGECEVASVASSRASLDEVEWRRRNEEVPMRRPLPSGSGDSDGGGVASALAALTQEQQGIVEAVRGGAKGVFFTGSAGTGKSLVLQHLRKLMDPSVTSFTATTGMAAVALGGTTVHAWAGFSPLVLAELDKEVPLTPPQLFALLHKEMSKRGDAMARWKKTRTLVVDEVSMMSAPFLDALEACGRLMRGSPLPFGGLQVVLAGDFFQLPPVYKGGTGGTSGGGRFAFQARCWGTCIPFCISLTKVFRQTGDGEFIALLNEARRGRVSEGASAVLRERWGAPLALPAGVIPTKLATHRADVEAENANALKSLPGLPITFKAVDTLSIPSSASLLAGGCPAPISLALKVGAQVILLKTLNPGLGLVNGARGVVVEFHRAGGGVGDPIVRFAGGAPGATPCKPLEVTIQPEVWDVCLGGVVVASRRALPLALAWTLSIHKSQGMTLDAVEMSLSRVFECGQAYVALSRARSLASLSLTDKFNPSCIRAHPDVVAFMDCLEKAQRRVSGGGGGEGGGGGGGRLPLPPPPPQKSLSPSHSHTVKKQSSPTTSPLKAKLALPHPPPALGALPRKASPVKAPLPPPPLTALPRKASPSKAPLPPPPLPLQQVPVNAAVKKVKPLTLRSFFHGSPPSKDAGGGQQGKVDPPNSPPMSPPSKMSRRSSPGKV